MTRYIAWFESRAAGIIENKKATIITVYIMCLCWTVSYALFRMEMFSDTLREYNTYFTFLKHESWLWRPLTDSMLSTSIFTTYLPSLVQRVLMLDNPEIVYRIFIAILSATAPTVLFAILRRYTGFIFSLLMVTLFVTSFYFMNSTMVARMIISATWSVLLLAELYRDNSRKKVIAVAIVGLLISHYTAVFIWLTVIAGAFALMSITRLFKRAQVNGLGKIAYTFAVLVFAASVYYGFIAARSNVWNYAISGANQVLAYANVEIPPVIQQGIRTGADGHAPEYLIKKDADVVDRPPPVGNQEANQGAWNHELPTFTDDVPNVDNRIWNHEAPVWNINPLHNERADFMIAELMVIIRGIAATVIITLAIKTGHARNPVVYIYGSSVLLSLFGIWSPEVATMLGSLRIAFIVLTADILSISYLYSKINNKGKYVMVPIVALLAYMPH